MYESHLSACVTAKCEAETPPVELKQYNSSMFLEVLLLPTEYSCILFQIHQIR